jgi:hypothetical protein
MKQFELFNDRSESSEENKYTSKIKAPVYTPHNKKPHILELCDTTKMYRLIQRIKDANITEEEKKFLKFAAQRHNVFNYAKIADYYAHSSKEMQQLMEHSALVIIDFEKAIQYGYVKLSEEMTQQYIRENEQD